MAQQAATLPPTPGQAPTLEQAPPPGQVPPPDPAFAEAAAPLPAYQRREGHPPSYGALDLGTNNCRLLIARPTQEGFTVIDAFSRVVRLGEGLATCGKISEEAQDRAVAALSV